MQRPFIQMPGVRHSSMSDKERYMSHGASVYEQRHMCTEWPISNCKFTISSEMRGNVQKNNNMEFNDEKTPQKSQIAS